MSTDKIPPFSEEAECGVLGCILIKYQESLFKCRELGVVPECFYIPANRLIYLAMLELEKGGKPVDSLMISDWMRGCGTLDRIGGDIKFDRLIDNTPTASRIDDYAGIIIEKYKRRTAIELFRKSEAKIYDQEESSADIISSVVSGALSLSGDVTVKRPSGFFHQQHIANRLKSKEHGSIGWPSKWGPLERILGSYHPPLNIVIGARPSVGKTVWMLEELINMAEVNKVPCAIASPDMDEFALRERMAGCISGVNMFKFRFRTWDAIDAMHVDEAWKKADTLPIYINDKRPTLDSLRSWIVTQVVSKGIKVFAIDFLQLMKKMKDEHRQMTTEVIGEWSSEIKDMGKKYGLVSVILSQLSRGAHKEKNVTPDPPTLETLRHSGEIEQNADVVILMSLKAGVSEEMFTHEYELWDVLWDVAKHRNGPKGSVPMTLYTTQNRFISRDSADMLREKGVK
mgnify:CR=1 FL=1